MNFVDNFINSRLIKLAKSDLTMEEFAVYAKRLDSVRDDMKEFGVSSEEDIKKYYLIKRHAKQIAKDLNISQDISKEMFTNGNADSFIDLYHSAASLKGLVKKSYQSGSYSGQERVKTFNIDKWVNAVKHIIAYEQQGKEKPFDQVLNDWDKMERMSFERWYKFYASGENMKYKTAQTNYINNGGGFIPQKQISESDLTSRLPIPDRHSVEDFDSEAQTQTQTPMPVEQDTSKKKSPKDTLISRLNSVEKIFTTDEAFRKLLGDSYAQWLSAFHQLKHKIQISASNHPDILKSLIIREANLLQKNGSNVAARAMLRVAQEAAPPAPAPEAAAPPPPDAGGGLDPMPDLGGGGMGGMDMGGGLDMGLGGGAEGGEEAEAEKEDDPDAAMIEFAANMSGDLEVKKDQAEENEKEANYVDDGAIIVVSEDDDDDLFKFGQALPTAPTPNQPPQAPNSELNEDQLASELDRVLDKVTISDVVKKLEYVTSLFKSKIIVRELQMIDLYLQALDLDSYFTQPLSETLNKNLEANQYGLNRIEDILSKLRGASEGAISVQEIRSKFRTEQKIKDQRDANENKPVTTDETQMPVAAPQPAPQPVMPPAPAATPIEQQPALQQPVNIEQPPPGVRV